MNLLGEKIQHFFKYVALYSFYPNTCQICQKRVANPEDPFCMQCIGRLEFTNFHLLPENPLFNKLKSLTPISNAASMMVANEGNFASMLIHDIKYYNKPDLAVYLGQWYGLLLKDTHYAHTDFWIPVPLHPQKEAMRGYNQSERIATGLVKSLKGTIAAKEVTRRKFTQTQTKLNKEERMENVSDVFEVQDKELFRQKNVVLVDDVITTGATILSLAEEIYKCLPASIKILSLGMAWND